MKEDASNFFPVSSYLKEIEIDFQDLPKSIVSKWIVPLFDNILLTEQGAFSYDLWLEEVKKSISFTSRRFQTKALGKAIEFAKKAYEYHLNNECPINSCWHLHESWERRIVLAENLLDEIEGNQIVKINIAADSGAKLQRELKESIEAFQSPIKALLASPEIRKRIDEMAQNFKVQKADYEKTWDSLKHYLQGQNYILPKDTKDFFYWFFTEKVGHLSPYQSSQTKISDNDFIEYSNWREANMKQTKSGNIPVAANFSFIKEPQPTIEQSVQNLLQSAYNTSGKTSHDLDYSIEVLHNVKTHLLFGNELTDAQREKYDKQLNLIEDILKEKRQKAKERETEEDEYRISKGLEPKYKVSPAVLEYIVDKIMSNDKTINVPDPVSNEKPDRLGYALLHHYWHQFSKDKTKAITKTNAESWSKKYGIAKGKLLEKVNELKHKYNFEPLASHHSKKQFAKQYELILPILKAECEPAFSEVEKRLKRLKKQNPTYFPE